MSLIYEYMEFDLSGLVMKYVQDQSTIKYFIKEILVGLQYIHEVCGIIHRDIKCNSFKIFSFMELFF